MRSILAMSLLRNNLRSWSRALRFFGTEVPNTTLDPVRLLKGGGRATPTILLKYSDFRLNKWLEMDKVMKHEDWIATRKEFISSREFMITEATVDMIIINLCLEKKRINSAMGYLEYLWDTNGEMNLSSMVTYLKLCYIREGQELNEKEIKYLVDIYDTVRKRYPIFDAHTGDCCVLGISKTNRWKESFEIFDIIKLSCKPRSITYSAIISAAFNNNEPEIGWKYLKEALARINPEHRVYLAYLDYCKRHFEGEELENAIGKMFKFWGDRDVRPYIVILQAYGRTLKNLGWRVDVTSIRDVGICRSCHHQLSKLKVPAEEFAKLARLVRERVIIGDDVYRKTTPEEFKNFLKFVQCTQPWDIVIDGLNVSHLTKSSQKADGYLVKNVVQKCVNMGKKVLVLGRKHMARWPSLDLKYIRQNAHIFLAEDRSADDPYLLYATLCSGPDTMFVSRDLMRQHKFLLEDPELTRVFKYWQMTHQLLPIGAPTSQRTVEIKLMNPPKYLPVVQNDENGWHVPFTFDSSLQPALVYEPPKSWICFRKNGPRTGLRPSPQVP